VTYHGMAADPMTDADVTGNEPWKGVADASDLRHWREIVLGLDVPFGSARDDGGCHPRVQDTVPDMANGLIDGALAAPRGKWGGIRCG